MIELQGVYLGNTMLSYLIYFSVLVVAVLVAKVITWISKTVLRQFASSTKTKADDIILTLLEGPVLLTVFVAAMFLAKPLLVMSEGFADFYSYFVSTLFIVNIAWYIVRFINGLVEHYLHPMAQKSETELDEQLIPIAKRLINVVVFAIAAIMIIDKFGYNVGSLLAGLGIGGLAFALAAKDLLGNLFGGLAIIIDKPFKINDRVKVGTEIDGFIREIGLRTTRIETFGGTMLTVPNSKMVDSISENITVEKARRMTFTIGVEYGTSVALLEKGKKIIEKHLKKIDGLDHEKYSVSFSEFANSSLNIRVQYWINKAGMKRYWGVQDELYTLIKKDFEKAGIEFAFPTQTLHLKQDEKKRSKKKTDTKKAVKKTVAKKAKKK